MTISGLLIIWLRQCLLGIWKGFLFPLFSYCRFWKEVTIHRSGRPCPTHLRTEHLYQVFVILLCEGFVYSLPFIYLLGHLFMLISTHRSSLDFTLLLSTAFSQWFQLCPLGPLSVVSWAPLTNSSKCQFLRFGFVFFWLFTSLYSKGYWIFDRTSKHKKESLAFNERTLERKSQVTELDNFYFEIQHLVKTNSLIY